MQVQENVKAAIEVEQGAKYDEELLEEVEKVLQPVKNLTWSSGRDENN
jgi:L-galactose dehydrogenase